MTRRQRRFSHSHYPLRKGKRFTGDLSKNGMHVMSHIPTRQVQPIGGVPSVDEHQFDPTFLHFPILYPIAIEMQADQRDL